MKQERFTAVGALFTAALASACCIGPLVFAVLGLGTFGLSGFFDTYRPYMMVATALFLGFGFYLTYRKRAVACENGRCEMRSAPKWNKITMWAVSVLAATFMLYPQWSGVFADSGGQANRDVSQIVEFDIIGMTCTGCAGTVDRALEGVAGVQSADVEFESGTAQVSLKDSDVPIEELVAAVKDAGYQAVPTQAGSK